MSIFGVILTRQIGGEIFGPPNCKGPKTERLRGNAPNRPKIVSRVFGEDSRKNLQLNAGEEFPAQFQVDYGWAFSERIAPSNASDIPGGDHGWRLRKKL